MSEKLYIGDTVRFSKYSELPMRLTAISGNQGIVEWTGSLGLTHSLEIPLEALVRVPDLGVNDHQTIGNRPLAS
jgi:hypothetical protein